MGFLCRCLVELTSSRTNGRSAGLKIGSTSNCSAMVPEPGIFDIHHAPSRELADDCGHCGFCLPSCPTYVLWGQEADSPRGRIYLMKAGLDARAAWNKAYQRHFDACLGCMACVTACPSGVKYDRLIEATRPQVERHGQRSIG